MIELLRSRGIVHDGLLRAMARVERHHFVLDAFLNRSYDDTALPISKSQTISQPYTVAFMTQELNPREGEKILEIGTGSGYQAAILAEMGCRVFTIERHAELLLEARRVLQEVGYRVASKVGDGTVGWSEFAPYDGIIVTAAAPNIPDALIEQLAPGGRLVIPVGDLDMQQLHVVTKTAKGLEKREISGFKFVPLIGKKGWGK
jgi:protein-L-isoaspartate(D-aspartate) O-methyltransferase